jgi:hypothetical protein
MSNKLYDLKPHRLAAILLVSTTLLVSCPSQAIGSLGFFLISQAFQELGSRAFGSISGSPFSHDKPPPSWAASIGAAELINAKLPIETADGFVLLMARAPAPAALEVIIQVSGTPAPTASQIDKAWGPGLIDMFCGPHDTVWTRWIRIGGSFGISAQAKDGNLIRQYGVSRSDCTNLTRSN